MKKLYHALCRAEVAVCAVGFVFLVAFIFVSAILRAFRLSVSWNIDLAMFLLAWTAFLGADVAWRSGQLVGIDIVIRRLPAKLQKVIEMIIYVIVFCALAIIVVFGIRLAITEKMRTYQSIPFLPYSLMTLSLVVAALSMMVSTVLKIRRCIFDLAHKGKGGAK
jgi:TRAP-type C4-dicarboxylate transport system permease small subunit